MVNWWFRVLRRVVRSCADGRACCAGVSSRRPTHFLSLRRKKVSKERATPLSASLRFAAGNLRCSQNGGDTQTRLRLKHASR